MRARIFTTVSNQLLRNNPLSVERLHKITIKKQLQKWLIKSMRGFLLDTSIYDQDADNFIMDRSTVVTNLNLFKIPRIIKLRLITPKRNRNSKILYNQTVRHDIEMYKKRNGITE